MCKFQMVNIIELKERFGKGFEKFLMPSDIRKALQSMTDSKEFYHDFSIDSDNEYLLVIQLDEAVEQEDAWHITAYQEPDDNSDLQALDHHTLIHPEAFMMSRGYIALVERVKLLVGDIDNRIAATEEFLIDRRDSLKSYRERYERLDEFFDCIRIIARAAETEAVNNDPYLSVDVEKVTDALLLHLRLKTEGDKFIVELSDRGVTLYRILDDGPVSTYPIESPLLVSYILRLADRLREVPSTFLNGFELQMQRVIEGIDGYLNDNRIKIWGDENFTHPETGSLIDLEGRVAMLEILQKYYATMIYDIKCQQRDSNYESSLITAIHKKYIDLGELSLKDHLGEKMGKSIVIHNSAETDGYFNLSIFEQGSLYGYEFYKDVDRELYSTSVVSWDKGLTVKLSDQPALAKTVFYRDIMKIFLPEAEKQFSDRPFKSSDNLDIIHTISPALVDRGYPYELEKMLISLKNGPISK